MKLRVTKLDVLIVLVIIAWIYLSFSGAKYFEVKGQDIFGAIMTYNTLSARGFGVEADITGTAFESQGLVKVSGIILGSTGERLYLWDSNKVWVVYQKERFLEMDQAPQAPYMYPSSITLRPSESIRVAPGECAEDSFSSQVLYLMLNQPANEVVCSYLTRALWEEYKGDVECIHGGSYLELNLRLLKGFDSDSLKGMIAGFGYNLERTWSSGRECLVIEYV